MLRNDQYVVNIFDLPDPFYIFNVFVRGKDFYMSGHSHNRFHVNTIVEGSVDVLTADGTLTVRAGEAFVMPPGVVHELHSKEGYYQIGMDVMEVSDAYGLAERLHTICGEKAIKVTVHHQGAVDYVTEKTLTDMSPLSRLRCINRMSELLVDIIESANEEQGKKNFRARFIDEAAKCAEARTSLEELCRRMNFSKTHLERLVKQEFGCSVIAYTDKLRYLKVCTLLTTTDQTLAEIAENCGFYDSAHLCVFFKKHCGKTPAAYRKEL